MTVSDFAWTDELTDRLKEFWAAGLTASRIAYGLGCSKNAVLGKINRLGLSGRDAGNKPFRVPPRAPKPKPLLVVSEPRPERLPVLVIKPTPTKPPPLALGDAFDPGDRQTFSLLDLRQGMCRWPYGESPVRYCGEKTTEPENPECPYCEMHARMAYVPARQQIREAA